MLSRMRRSASWLVPILAAACSNGSRVEPYVSPFEDSQLLVEDVAVGGIYSATPSRMAIRAIVIPSGCTVTSVPVCQGCQATQPGLTCQGECPPAVQGLEGTYGDTIMGVTSRGGDRLDPVTQKPTGTCLAPTLTLDVGPDDPVTTNVVELRDATSMIHATFPIETLRPRHVSSPDGWALCGGEVQHLIWDHPADLAAPGSPPQIFWIEAGIPCVEACPATGSFTVNAMIAGDGQMTATVPAGVMLTHVAGNADPSAGTLHVKVPAAAASGDADTCEGATRCSYRFSHVAYVAAATYTSSCM